MSESILDDEQISEVDTLYKGQIEPDQHEAIFRTLWHYKEIAELAVMALEDISNTFAMDRSGYREFITWKLATDTLEEIKRRNHANKPNG